MLELRFRACIAVLLLSLCVAAIADPIRVANFLYRRRIAEPGDLYFELAYRLIALTGAAITLYILTTSLWALAHS